MADGYVSVNTVGSQSLSAAKRVSANHHPVVQAVHRAVIARVDASLNDAYNGGRPAAAKVGARLQNLGLLETAESAGAARWAPVVVMTGILILGIMKFIVGIGRDKPVVYLGLLCLATTAAIFCFASRIKRTLRGERLLAQLRAEHSQLKDSKELIAQPVEVWPIGLGLFGLGAMALAPGTADLYRWMKPPASAYGSGCTGRGSACGGGGGGGGCGGGD